MGKTIVFDFDGVIHKYSKGWQDGSIYDEPTPGVSAVIEKLHNKGYEIVVVSSRCSTQAGIDAIASYLDRYQIKVDRICKEKPPALVYVDDRAICFDGNADNLYTQITTFKTWQQKEKEKHVNRLF